MADSSQVSVCFKVEDLNLTLPQSELPDPARAPTPDPVQSEPVAEPGHQALAFDLSPEPVAEPGHQAVALDLAPDLVQSKPGHQAVALALAPDLVQSEPAHQTLALAPDPVQSETVAEPGHEAVALALAPGPAQSEPGLHAVALALAPDPVQSEPVAEPGHQAVALALAPDPFQSEPVAEPGLQAVALALAPDPVQSEPVAEPEHQAVALALAPVPASASSSPAGTPSQMKHKNRLQEYTQRASLPLPMYQTVNLGSQHAPKFWSTVVVDGTTYSSSNTFLHRKAAEQDAARVALECIPEKIKYEGPPIICEDTTFCKSILNEYAVKMNFDMPAYNTVQSQGPVPVFVSSLVFNRVSYTGNAGKNKKEAEQLAARAVILSLLGDNKMGTILYEIIKSKDKLYAAIHKGKNFQTHHNSTLNGGSTGSDYGMPVTQDKEALDLITLVGPGASSVANQPHYNYKKRKAEPPFEPNHLPITFVPPFSAQPLGDGPSYAKKRRKNKKKANKKLQNGDELSLCAFPLSQSPSYSVAQ